MHSDEQIESWVNQMKGVVKDQNRSKEQKESDLDDLEEQIKIGWMISIWILKMNT